MKEYNLKLKSLDFDFNYFSAKAHLVFNYKYFDLIFIKSDGGFVYVINNDDGDIAACFPDESDFSDWLQNEFWDQLMDDCGGKIENVIGECADEAFWKAHPEVLANIEI